MSGLRYRVGLCLVVLAWTPLGAWAGDQPTVVLSDYFPPPEEQGGWRTLLPAEGEPDDSQKARIREVGGVDWDCAQGGLGTQRQRSGGDRASGHPPRP